MVLEAAKLAYTNKTKESITSQKLGSSDFWQIANRVLNKGKYGIPPLFNSPEMLSSASDKAKSKISLTPKMVKKVIMNLGLSKPSGLDCISAVVLKDCEPEFSCILAELFNKCLKESCFPDC